MKCLQAWSSLRSHAAEGAQCERQMERSGCDISIKNESREAESSFFTLTQVFTLTYLFIMYEMSSSLYENVMRLIIL